MVGWWRGIFGDDSEKESVPSVRRAEAVSQRKEGTRKKAVVQLAPKV